MTSQQDHTEYEGTEEDVKPRSVAVRRNLFGPVDHQQLQQDFQKMLFMSMEVAKQRWNFDFQNEQPVPGSIQWEETQWQDVPAFYRSCVVRPGKQRLELAYRGTPLEQREARPLRVRYRQATITDFFTAKKKKLLHCKVPSSRQFEESHFLN